MKCLRCLQQCQCLLTNLLDQSLYSKFPSYPQSRASKCALTTSNTSWIGWLKASDDALMLYFYAFVYLNFLPPCLHETVWSMLWRPPWKLLNSSRYHFSAASCYRLVIPLLKRQCFCVINLLWLLQSFRTMFIDGPGCLFLSNRRFYMLDCLYSLLLSGQAWLWSHRAQLPNGQVITHSCVTDSFPGGSGAVCDTLFVGYV